MRRGRQQYGVQPRAVTTGAAGAQSRWRLLGDSIEHASKLSH